MQLNHTIVSRHGQQHSAEFPAGIPGRTFGPVATYAYADAGTHYWSVDTEGRGWSLVPVTR